MDVDAACGYGHSLTPFQNTQGDFNNFTTQPTVHDPVDVYHAPEVASGPTGGVPASVIKLASRCYLLTTYHLLTTIGSKMPEKPIDPITLQELLKQHEAEKTALRQEFEDSTNTTENVTRSNADKRISLLAPDAWTALQWIVNNAESESARLSAAKYILDITMGKKLPGATTSEDKAIEDLIESLRPKP